MQKRAQVKLEKEVQVVVWCETEIDTQLRINDQERVSLAVYWIKTGYQ
jgi:hypothetical protein